MSPSPLLVLITGPPCTGKSTLAETAASSLSASVLAWDWVMASLTPFGSIQVALQNLEVEEHRRVGWSVLWNLAVAQLRNGRSVVLDGVARDIEIETTHRIAADLGASCLVVVTRCSDARAHRSRLERRQRDIPGWHELDWEHVNRFLERWEEPLTADLYLDASLPLDGNFKELITLLTSSSNTATSRASGAERFEVVEQN